MEQQEDNILELKNVSNFYTDLGTSGGMGFIFGSRKKQVLKNVDLVIHRDEFFGLVGESGSGKSTMANCILGLLPYEGEILVAGRRSPYDPAAARTPETLTKQELSRNIQAVFQDPLSSLDPRKAIGFTLQEPLKAHKKYLAEKGIITSEQDRIHKVNEMLSLVGLDPSYASRYPGELSGGQRQRVCIAASLMLSPPLIIADEAISALDVSVGSQILNLFREIHDKEDFAMLFISHNLNVVYYLCDRIAVLYKGQIVEQGESEILYHDPRHPYTKMLLSAVPGSGSNADPGKNTLHRKEEAAVQALDSPCPYAGQCPYAGACDPSDLELKDISVCSDDGTRHEHLVRCCRL